MSLIINKFGGGIINCASAIRHLPEIFARCAAENSVNVFSAFGKTTNNLERVVKAHLSGEKKEMKQALDELKAFHLEIASELFPKEHAVFSEIENIFKKIEEMLERAGTSDPKFIYDQIVPYGEILASIIVSNYFSKVGVKNKLISATDFMKTDSTYNTANVDKQATLKNLNEKINEQEIAMDKNIITQGFIGFCDQGMTTLGREGSDYTAGLLGNLLEADKVVLWKDVPGVMEKNPKLPGNEDAKKIDCLTYDRLIELLQTTASGLVHPKTLNEVKEKHIPLQVRPFWVLESEGTLIS
jgi:aspartate kinase